MHYDCVLDLLNNPTFSVRTVQHCCDLETWPRSLKVIWAGKAQWLVPTCTIWQLPHNNVIWVNPNIKVFDKPRYLTNNNSNQKHVNYLPWIRTSHTNHIMHFFFLSKHVAIMQCLNNKGQEYKMPNLQFIFLAHLWPWNKVKVIKPTMTM